MGRESWGQCAGCQSWDVIELDCLLHSIQGVDEALAGCLKLDIICRLAVFRVVQARHETTSHC